MASGRRSDGYYGNDPYEGGQAPQRKDSHQAPSKKGVSKWAVLAVVFSILAMSLLAASFALPWYSDELNSGGKYTGVRWYLLDAEVMNETGSHRLSFDDEILKYSESVTWLLGMAMALAVLGIVFALLMMLVSLFIGLGKAPKWAGIVIGVLAMVFCLASPLALLLGMPVAYTKDIEAMEVDGIKGECIAPGPCDSFQGSEDFGDNGLWSWGGDWGWILSWAAWAFAMLAMISILGVPKKGAAGKGRTREPPGGPGQEGPSHGRTGQERQGGGAQQRPYDGPDPEDDFY